MSESQKTIFQPVEERGVGVHSGQPALLKLLPADADSGIVFLRTDLPGAPEIRCESAAIDQTMLSRMTTLFAEVPGGEPARVQMIEHLLSACAGLGVWNLRVELDGPECPIFDGSSRRYVEMLNTAGVCDLGGAQPRLGLREIVTISSGSAEIVAIPAERMQFTYFAEFRHAGFADQQVTFVPGIDDYAEQVALARTFCFWDDVEKLREAGLIKGGSLDCAIVLRDGAPYETEYRIENELARHKMLDLIGDLAVLGAPLNALVSARCSGHALHQEFAAKLMDYVEPVG